MDYIIHPYEGIELPDGRQINFNMTAKQVRELIGEPDYLQRPGPHIIEPRQFGYVYDHNFGFVIHFDIADEKVKDLVIGPEPVQVYLNGFSLIGDYGEVAGYLSSLGGEVIDGAGQPHYLKVGIAIYNTLKDEVPVGDEYPIGVSSFVTVFRQGYTDNWEDERKRIRQDVTAKIKLETKEEVRADIESMLAIDLDKFLES